MSISLEIWMGMALGAVCWLAQTPVAAAGSSDDGAKFQQVIRYHLDRYPELEIQDLYKLIFQAAMGSEHAVPDRQGAQQWLQRELSTLSTNVPQPLTEPLSPDGTLVRVHLRTYAEAGRRTEDLLDAFVNTADRYSGSTEDLRRYRNQAKADRGVHRDLFAGVVPEQRPLGRRVGV